MSNDVHHHNRKAMIQYTVESYPYLESPVSMHSGYEEMDKRECYVNSICWSAVGVYNIWGLFARSYIIYCMIPFLHGMGCPQANMLDSLHIIDIDSTIVMVIIIPVPWMDMECD